MASVTRSWAKKMVAGGWKASPKTSADLSAKQAAWVRKDPKNRKRADNPPAWVEDEAAWGKAKAAVEKNWGSYDEPWAVVAHVYDNMAD